MTFNDTLNNALTYRDRRLHGWRFLTGLVSFAALCSWELSPPLASQLSSTKPALHGGSPALLVQQWEHCGTMSRGQPSPGVYADAASRWNGQSIRDPSHPGLATDQTPLKAWQGRCP